jgi:hypothetical protein
MATVSPNASRSNHPRTIDSWDSRQTGGETVPPPPPVPDEADDPVLSRVFTILFGVLLFAAATALVAFWLRPNSFQGRDPANINQSIPFPASNETR